MLKKYLSPYKKQFIIGSFFKLVEAVLELLVPTIMASRLIDIGISGKAGITYILKIGLVMIALALLGLGCALICQYNASVASQGTGTMLRNAVFEHIGTLSFRELDAFGTSTLLNRITGDINTIQQAVAMVIRLASRAPFICLGSIVMSMLLNWKLSLIIFASIPIFALIIWLIMHFTVPLYKKVQSALDSIGNKAIEIFDGVRVVRAFARQKEEKEKFDKSVDDFTKLSVFVGRISAILNPATVFVMNFVIIAILWAGGIEVNAGGMTQGEIIAFTTYISYIMTALLVLANLIVLFTKAAASKNRVEEILSVTTSLSEGKEDGFNDCRYAVEFNNVSFGYNKSANALENISFKLERGQNLGIIGGTGSGKTTLVNLISRFYDADSGEVIVFGRNVKEYAFDNLRTKVSMAMQKPFIFSGTVADNIRQGMPGASQEDVTDAAKTAQAEEFILDMDNGYESRVEAEGRNLSGGQKQRLSIARAIVNKAPVLILDDSSSALDLATDLKLRKALREDKVAENVIIVSQRVSTIQNCDVILVLDDGKIAGMGTHSELLDNCAEYREIYTSQIRREEK